MFLSFIWGLLSTARLFQLRGPRTIGFCWREDMLDAGGAGGCAINRPLHAYLVVEGNEDAPARRCSGLEARR